MKSLVFVLSLLLVMLGYRALFGDGSLQELDGLKVQVNEARAELERLESRNQSLRAEVEDLKNGLDAVEERARIELGMIGSDETFYQFVRRRPAAGSSANSNTDSSGAGSGDAASNQSGARAVGISQ